MRYRKYYCCGGPAKFFRLTLSYESLVNYFQLNFSLMQHHNYSLTEIENMIPWEREIYVTMLINHLKEERDKILQKKLKDQ